MQWGMIRLVIILVLFLGGTVQAQVFEDGFSDEEFATNPVWSGADSNFVVFDLEGNSVLRLNAAEAGTSYLSTSSSGIEGYWEFFVRIDGSKPSGSNKAEIILVSDQADLMGNFNGYGVRIGETGDDFFRLIRYEGGEEASIILSDTTIFQSNGEYRLKVTRDEIGNWNLEVGEGYNGEAKNSGNPWFDDTYQNSSFIGVKVSYTSSRTDDFYFDFKIDSISVIEPEFDEFEIGDVLINEFLKDPPPGTGIPEYVEIMNVTNKVLNLKNWEIGDNSNFTTLTENDFVLHPDTFLVLTNNPEDLKSVFGGIFTLDVSLPTLNNSTDQIRIKTGEGNPVDSLEYNTDWGGVDVALERRGIEVSSTLKANWGDSPAEFGGTPGKVNEVEPDRDAPDILNYQILSDFNIQLIFSEQILDSSASNIENFELTNPLSASPILLRPSIVEFASPNTIRLTFDQELFELNLLEIFNQTDVFGNTNDRISIEFEYVVTTQAQEGEVKITEFAYDAPEGFSEFVEIFNPTEKNFDLQGWTFNDNSRNPKRISNTSFFLKAGEYAILAPDSTIIENFGEKKLLDIPGFPALNNSTDALVMRNQDGVLMDSLTFTSSWGGNEVSLERRSVDFPAIYYENWGDSPSENGGTPGSANEILLDVEPPFVVESGFDSNNQIQLIFNERLFGESAENPTNYSSSEGLIPVSIILMADTVLLNYSTPFEDGSRINIQLENLQDLFGNAQNQQVISLGYVEVSTAERFDVVINEILFRRKDAISPEFVELFNPTENNFDLSGWTFSDAGTTIHLPEDLVLNSEEYLVLTDREDLAKSLSNGFYLSNFPSLNDSGDEIIIKNSNGLTIDSLFYEPDWGNNESGISIERKDPLAASTDASNWENSTSETGNSAGEKSSVFEEDLTPPNILFSSIRDSSLFIAFTEVVQVTNETEILFQNSNINLSEISGLTGSEITIGLGSSTSKSRRVYDSTTLSIRNLSDFKGNVATSISSLIAEPLEQGDIIINEILYNPLADNEDNLPDQTEYVELYNPTNRAISIEGIFLHDAPDEDNEIRAIYPVTTQFKWIAPDSYILIYSEDEADEFNQSRNARYFDLDEVEENEVIQVDRSSLSLASTGDAIYLADIAGITIDSVFYNESWQNPNVYDTRGVALERIDPLGPGNNATNWSSSTHPSGGTPLLQNTIFQEPGLAPDGNGISFTPNPFSPDDDGFEDNLFINYNLDAPDYLLRVRIFDRYGREVRELVNNYQAGFEGSLIWDGLTDDRTKNRVGIYIVYFEAYDSASGRDQTFKETVVLARKF